MDQLIPPHKQSFFLIAGPCVIESEALVLHVAEKLVRLCSDLKIPLIFKASFDKANRTSSTSFRGLGLSHGLTILDKVKSVFGCPVISDVHEDTPLNEVADVLDYLQTPAFLCRQTNFIQNVARTQKTINLKKGQFLSPWEMQHVVQKCKEVGNDDLMVCERGFSFGYQNLVADMRSLLIMREFGLPVVFDATHSVQLPGGQGNSSSGQREFIPGLARAAAACGVQGVFMETHPNPDRALSDGPNSWPLQLMRPLLSSLKAIHDSLDLSQLPEKMLSHPIKDTHLELL